MRYKIIMDSCGELPEEYVQDERFERVPLSLEVGDYQIMDDESFDQAVFLQKVAESPKCPKSSCPSPQSFMEAYHCEAEHVYAITLASNLSGSYNSAVLGVNLYHETYGAKEICVVDSESASCGETQIALMIMELEEKGLPFAEIVDQVNAYRDSMRTYFVLDNLETLRKNGRLTGLKAGLVSTLNLKPIMSADKGVICQKSQGIGMKKALRRMADIVLDEAKEKDQEHRRLMISHCNAPERAELVREMIMEKAKFKGCIILDTKGVSSMYANDGGVIVTV